MTDRGIYSYVISPLHSGFLVLGFDVGEDVLGGTAYNLPFTYHLDTTLNLSLLIGAKFEMRRVIKTKDQIVRKAGALAGR